MLSIAKNQPFDEGVDDAHQQAVFLKAQELLRDRNTFAEALGADGMAFVEANKAQDYVDDLAELVLADDATSFGRQMLDQVIQYVWAKAEQDVNKSALHRPH